MKALWGILSVLLITAAVSSFAVTSEPNPPAGGPATSAPPAGKDLPGANMIQGRVMKIDKDDFFIMDVTGQQWHLKIDPGTKIQGEPKVGDRIEAEISSKGRASSIKKLG